MSNTTRRDFLTGIGQAAAVVAACAQGCEGEASEPPDIARAHAQDNDPGLLSWQENGTRAGWSRYERRTNGRAILRVELRDLGYVGTLWPNGAAPLVERKGDVLVLTVEWNLDTAWEGRELRRRGNRIEQYVFGDGTLELVGEA